MVVFLTEITTSRVRTASFALGYSLATALFCGFRPAIATGLIHVTGAKAIPGAWVLLAALGGLAALDLKLRNAASNLTGGDVRRLGGCGGMVQSV